MNRTLVSFVAAAIFAVGCATTVSLPDRLDKFVEKTERNIRITLMTIGRSLAKNMMPWWPR